METKTYEYIKALYPEKESRKKFLSLVALTYGIQITTLSKILGIPNEVLMVELKDKNVDFNDSMQFLFNHGTRNQNLAVTRFTDFFHRLVAANRQRNHELTRKILLEIYDSDAKKFKESHEPGTPVTDEELRTLIVYQIKYGLSVTLLGDLFGVSRKQLSFRINKYFDEHPEEVELKEDYEYLSGFYAQKYLDRQRGYDGNGR